MTFRTPLKLKLAALVAGMSVAAAVAPLPAQAGDQPRPCGTVKAKGKRWPIRAQRIPCTDAKRWAITYIKTFKTPRYYKCKRSAVPEFYRTCDTNHYPKKRTFFILKP